MTNVKIIPSSCRKQVTVTMPVSFLGHVFRLFMRLRRINVTVTLSDTGPPASPERSRWRAGFVTLTVTNS